MASSTIPVDLRNPGQVFACLGLMEAAEILHGQPCEGGFDYRDLDIQTTFTLRTDGTDDPVAAVVQFLARAEVKALVPHGSPLSVAEWGVNRLLIDGKDSFSFPCPVPSTPAALPVVLTDGTIQILVDHWADGPATGRDNVKFWAGMGGKPGAAVVQELLRIVRTLSTEMDDLAFRPFSASSPLTAGLRLDWRRDYTAINAGFSPNFHKNTMKMLGYPLVELLAAIGMQNARPERPNLDSKLLYRYGVSNLRLPTAYVRVVLGAKSLWHHPFQHFPIRIFRMRLDWPGKENQARCIVDAEEEFEP